MRRRWLAPSTEVALLMSITQVLAHEGPYAARVVTSKDLFGVMVQLMAIEMFRPAVVAITASKGTMVAAFLAILGPFGVVFKLCNDFVLFGEVVCIAWSRDLLKVRCVGHFSALL